MLKLSQTRWQAPDVDGWLLFLLAPFEYTPLAGGAIAGYLIWDEVPDRWVVSGALVIIASGLFLVYREIGAAISAGFSRRPQPQDPQSQPVLPAEPRQPY